jgi:hypothetical protein
MRHFLKGYESIFQQRKSEAEWISTMRFYLIIKMQIQSKYSTEQALAGLLWSKQYYHYDI